MKLSDIKSDLLERWSYFERSIAHAQKHFTFMQVLIYLLVKLTVLLSLKNYGWETSTSGFSSKLSDIILMYVYAYTMAMDQMILWI